MNRQRLLSAVIGASFCACTLVLAGCNQQQPDASSPPAAASSGAPAPANAASNAVSQATAAYTPPSADELYQLVAPIALFPDKLVAQVLAGSTYPDQITAADQLMAQNPKLQGTLLQAAVDPQPWDASVKGLTQFPSTLDQMAQNIQWTTALGQAYANDPTDVLNAIQVMRQRASAHGNLRSSQRQQVTTRAATPPPPQDTAVYADDGGEPVYNGPAVVPAPAQVIEIEPAQEDTVYVPTYDPQTVYGGDVAYYPGYTYARPAYSGTDLLAVGAVTFGVGVLIGSMHDHYHRDDGGWHSWGMHWGGGRPDNGGGWHRPAVVYNNHNYVSRSTTVINHYTTNNITNVNSNNRTVNNNVRVDEHRPGGPGVPGFAPPGAPNPAMANAQGHHAFDGHNMAQPPGAQHPQAQGQPQHMTIPNFAQGHRPGETTQPHGPQAHGMSAAADAHRMPGAALHPTHEAPLPQQATAHVGGNPMQPLHPQPMQPHQPPQAAAHMQPHLQPVHAPSAQPGHAMPVSHEGMPPHMQHQEAATRPQQAPRPEPMQPHQQPMQHMEQHASPAFHPQAAPRPAPEQHQAPPPQQHHEEHPSPRQEHKDDKKH
ncbi:DUF3300 domain-containing protein [Dyella sp.]|uniref:DUF3300 domain-containing protein n=1 Tax=Dyella sp. TaxID=1869338 RepID=UPI002ED2E441